MTTPRPGSALHPPAGAKPDEPVQPDRRRWLFASASAVATALPAASVAAALGAGEAPAFVEGRADAPIPASGGSAWSWFTESEAAFVTAAVARLIPRDDLGPGAVEAGVPTFIDRQLAGPYGRAERWYMQGPWDKGTSTQGWQTRLTPAGLYRAAIRAIDPALAKEQVASHFDRMAAADQDVFLHRLERGDVDLGGVDAKAFFALLWQNTLEGFWSDPQYGGNLDMAGWKLIGFPGARYDQLAFVGEHGARYPLPPVGLRGRIEWTRG
ncbi:MAG TPA: gluconate 2-dehydrogenase subunit 3 family protein [Burkholderiaceae bacterium]|nr:gluconate 2-dehydrogenase subunit 3 family protein [Burkholderiaceae bacterium]